MAYTDREDLNLLGVLYRIGQYSTPFLSSIGGMGNGKISKSFNFPLSQYYSLSAASQAVVSEATAAAATTATTITRSQVYNVCQIMKRQVGVSFAKQSTTGEFSGVQVIGEQPVQDELAFQKEAQLAQLAIDIEYSFLQGTYVASNDASTAQSTRGIIEAIVTNSVAAGTTDLSKTHIDNLLRTMVGNGAPLNQPVLFCNGFQKQMISDIYALAPMDRNYGGVNIKTIETDFAVVGVVYAPQMPTNTVLIADLAYCSPVYCPYDGQLITFQEVAVTAAQKGGFFYTQVGLDYANEKFHGIISGLTTS
jgi:hypothetical protein